MDGCDPGNVGRASTADHRMRAAVPSSRTLGCGQSSQPPRRLVQRLVPLAETKPDDALTSAWLRVERRQRYRRDAELRGEAPRKGDVLLVRDRRVVRELKIRPRDG